MPEHNNDIDELLSLLERGGWERYRATAAALVAERDRLLRCLPPSEGTGVRNGPGQGSWSVFAEKVVAERDRLAEDLKWQQDLYDGSCVTNAQLRKRIAELEAAPKPADRDLRADLVCSIYPILLAAAWSRATASLTPEEMAKTHTAMRELALEEADLTLAAMRKGEEP